MPDQVEETEVKIGVVAEDGTVTEMTEEVVTKMLNDSITVHEVVVSVGETRQLKEYQPNSYHLTFKSDVSGVADVLKTISTQDDTKTVKKMFLALLTAKMAGQVASMKRFIHSEMVKDGFDVNTQIDWRKGEKEKILGN